MNKIKQRFEKSLELFLNSLEGDSINTLIKTVLESLMRLERSEFLDNCNHPHNKGNGYYERVARSLTNHFKLKVPRDRLGLFRPVFLEAINDEKAKIDQLAFNMYVKGVSTRDAANIIQDVFGQKYSASSVSNIRSQFTEMREAWQNKKLSKEYYFIYIDATYLPIRRNREVDKEAFHVIMGVTKDLKREILGIYNYPSESSLGYKEIFIDLRRRGFRKSLLCIADGFKRIKKALQEEFPGIPLQTCLFYKLKNLKSRIRSNKWQEFLSDFHSVFKKEETIIIQKKMSYWN